MDLQSESEPQPSGKINKAAFKLFGKRKPGSPVSSIFSIRSKGEGGKGAAKAPLVRSNTHDGIMETTAELEGSKKEEPTAGNQPHTVNEAIPTVSPRTSFSSITSVKSLSFFTLLRRSSRAGDGGRSVLSEPRPSSRRRRGLKGLFSSVRWQRKDQGTQEQEEPPPPALLLASRSNSVEIVKEHMTLTPRPLPRGVDAQTPPTHEADEDAPIPATLDDGSPLMEMAGDQWNKIFFPYSALAPREISTLPTADTTEAQDMKNSSSSRTEDSRVEQEGSGRQGTDKTLDGDGLQGKGEMVNEEKACPTSIPTGTPAPAPVPMLKPASVPSSSFSVTSAPSPGSGPVFSPASIPVQTLSPASIPMLASTPKPTQPIASLTATPAILSTPIPAHAPTPLHAHSSSPALAPDSKITPNPARMATPISAYTPTPPPAQKPSLPPTPAPIPTCTPVPPPAPTHRSSQAPAQTPVPALKPTCVSIPAHTSIMTSAPAHTPTPPAAHTTIPSPVHTPSPTPAMSPVPTQMPSPVPSPALTPVSGHVPVLDAIPPPGFKPTAQAVVSMDTEEDISGQEMVCGEAMTCRNRVEEFYSQEKVLDRAMTCTEKGKELVRQDGFVGRAVGHTNGGNKPSSQDEDIKAQSQGLQHLVLQREDGSPASPSLSQPDPHRPEKRPPPVKALGLSKIPVSGCTRAGKQPREVPTEDGQSKDPQDIPPNYDEGYWDSPTSGLEEEGASFLAQEGEESTMAAGEKTTPISTHEPKLTPSTQGSGRPLKGNSSLPRDSKIPIKQPMSYTTTLGMATSATTPTTHTHGTKTEAPRTKIPVSKVPVRRTTARPAPVHDHPRK